MFQNYSKAHHLNFAVGVSSAVFVAFLFTGCEEEKQAPVVREVRRIKGEVEVLNSCSMKGAAVKMRSFLRNNGFDVVHIDNERLQNYDETIIVLREIGRRAGLKIQYSRECEGSIPSPGIKRLRKRSQ